MLVRCAHNRTGFFQRIDRLAKENDVYAKTLDGWRFKSRMHVFPNISESIQFGSGAAR
jgi:hypothetical protein